MQGALKSNDSHLETRYQLALWHPSLRDRRLSFCEVVPPGRGRELAEAPERKHSSHQRGSDLFCLAPSRLYPAPVAHWLRPISITRNIARCLHSCTFQASVECWNSIRMNLELQLRIRESECAVQSIPGFTLDSVSCEALSPAPARSQRDLGRRGRAARCCCTARDGR